MTAKIIDGPSKWNLMLSLFDGDSLHRRPVFFFTDAPAPNGLAPRVEVYINIIEREDGSGENWNFDGCLKDSTRVKGFFSTSRRRGWLEVKS